MAYQSRALTHARFQPSPRKQLVQATSDASLLEWGGRRRCRTERIPDPTKATVRSDGDQLWAAPTGVVDQSFSAMSCAISELGSVALCLQILQTSENGKLGPTRNINYVVKITIEGLQQIL